MMVNILNLAQKYARFRVLFQNGTICCPFGESVAKGFKNAK